MFKGFEVLWFFFLIFLVFFWLVGCLGKKNNVIKVRGKEKNWLYLIDLQDLTLLNALHTWAHLLSLAPWKANFIIHWKDE